MLLTKHVKVSRVKFGNDIIYCKVDKLEYGHDDNKSYLQIT